MTTFNVEMNKRLIELKSEMAQLENARQEATNEVYLIMRRLGMIDTDGNLVGMNTQPLMKCLIENAHDFRKALEPFDAGPFVTAG